MIYLTDKALAKLNELADGEGIDPKMIRVRIIGGGCSGFMHDMYFETKVSDMDEEIKAGDFTIVVDPLSATYLEEAVIDYLEGAMESGFKFSIPNVKSTCGCGNSVSF